MGISNVLESYLMGHNQTLSGALKSQELEKIKETHPVAILFFVVLAGEVWGPVGMLVSVPFVALARLMFNLWGFHKEPCRDIPASEMGEQVWGNCEFGMRARFRCQRECTVSRSTESCVD